MTQVANETREHEWFNYYERFPYFAPQKVRPGCHPRIMEHDRAAKAVVLVHGLSDSPYFMTAIAEFFHKRLGYNVYLPLLHCHGLKEPKGMEGVQLEEWKANVSFAITTAASRCAHISIGGLSTGGALSFYMAANHSVINGALYLFSAALDLAGGPFGLVGEAKEKLLLSRFLTDVLDQNKPLIGDNPYRYSHIDLDGARELARLIQEIDELVNAYGRHKPFPKRVFAAHSESDTTADIAGIEKLEQVSDSHRFYFFRIPKRHGVAHASLVLKDPIPKHAQPLEKENPQFQMMMDTIAEFQ